MVAAGWGSWLARPRGVWWVRCKKRAPPLHFESAREGVSKQDKRTAVVPLDARLHDRLHPFTYDRLLIRTEVMRLVGFVDDLETVPPGIQVLVRDDFVPCKVDVAFDPRFLKERETGASSENTTLSDARSCCHRASNRDVYP